LVHTRDAGPRELRRKPSGFWRNVLGLYVGNVASAFVNAWAVAVLVARIMQSLVHVCFVQTNTVVSVRFGFFCVQIASFLWLTGILLTKLSGSA
jgi:TctA family transporter